MEGAASERMIVVIKPHKGQDRERWVSAKKGKLRLKRRKIFVAEGCKTLAQVAQR